MRLAFAAGLIFFGSLLEAQEVVTRNLTRAAGPIAVDGTLDDAGWQGATRFDTWYETNPGDNVEPKAKSLGMVTYDDRFIYAAIEMWDPNPSQIRSIYGDHDNISGNIDDYAGILLDTRDDSKTGYLFLVNARNIQYDATTDDASGEDNAPDFYWDSAVKRTEKGWNVELRIPFSSLRYNGANPARWGLSLYRNMPRDRRYQIFTDKLPRGGNCFVCRWGKVTGLTGLPTGGSIIAAPYVTGRIAGAREGALGTPIDYGNPTGDIGADVKWTPTADTAVDATINPDFSQVESDVAVISTNQRFAIFVPEKRPFFLEGTDLFATPIQTVYTRTITQPLWGIRSTGRIGKNSYTALLSDDRGGGVVIIPSALGSGFANQEYKSKVFIGRIKRDFGENSFFSFLATARESDGAHNRVFGPDFQWKLKNHTLTGQLLFSDTATPNRPSLAGEWDGREMQSRAGHFWYQYSTRTNDFYTEYRDFGTDFRADNGFVPQVDFRSNYAEGGHTFWPKDNFFSRIRTFVMGQYDAQQDGSRLYSLASAGFGADGKYRSFTRLRYAYDKVRTDNEEVRTGKQQIFTRHQLLYQLQFGLSKILSFVTFNGWVGQEVDYDNNRLANGADINMTATLRTNDHLQLSVTAGNRWLTEDLGGTRGSGRLFTSQVERIRAMYTFNSRMFVRAIVQNTRTNRNRSLYDFPVNQHSGALSTQLLFAYKVNWQTLMYVGIGDDMRATSVEGELEPDTRQVFFKVSYAFQR